MPPRPILPAGLLSRQASSRSPACLSLALRPAPASRTFVSSPASRDANKDTTAASTDSHAGTQSSAFPKLPPVSPRFIQIPTPPQAEEVRRPPHRGHLPVPRDVFHERRKGADYATRTKKSDAAAWTARAAPHSEAELKGEEPRSNRAAWRRTLAESRRQNLEEGLAGLWARQQRQQRRERARAQRVSSRNRRAALFKPEGKDDVLTRSSVRLSVAANTAVVRDPERHERQAASAARTAALAQAKREARRDALMELYQAAGKFIVDEKELEQKVEELFRPDYFKEEGYSYGTVNAENIWDVVGKPSTVQDMMSGITRTETRLYDARRTEADRTTKRQKLVAEALTGGKMPV